MEKTDRKTILKNFLDTIEAVSNKGYQKRVWIEGKGPECDDFGEFINYFSPESKDILEDYKNFGITKNQHQKILNLHNKILAISDKYSEAFEFIDSPEWLEIVEMAKDVLEAFDWKPPADGLIGSM